MSSSSFLSLDSFERQSETRLETYLNVAFAVMREELAEFIFPSNRALQEEKFFESLANFHARLEQLEGGRQMSSETMAICDLTLRFLTNVITGR